MKEMLEFYDIKTRTKFRTSDWRIETKPSRLLGKTRYFAVAKIEAREAWRIISEEFALECLEARGVNEQRTLEKLKEPGKLSARIREGWGFGGESFLADEIEMLEDENERWVVEYGKMRDALNDAYAIIDEALGGE